MAQVLERYRGALVVLVLVGIVGGAFVLFYKQTTARPTLEIVLPTATPKIPKEVRVYVTGQVVHPGVYTLRDSDRVEDAIRIAGGPTSEADLIRINLAARVRDEQQVHVPKLGDGAASTSGSPEQPGKINVNGANEALLETLPRVGEVTAKKIIDYRTKNGPFKRPEDLRDLKLVTASVYEEIKDLITAE